MFVTWLGWWNGKISKCGGQLPSTTDVILLRKRGGLQGPLVLLEQRTNSEKVVEHRSGIKDGVRIWFGRGSYRAAAGTSLVGPQMRGSPVPALRKGTGECAWCCFLFQGSTCCQPPARIAPQVTLDLGALDFDQSHDHSGHIFQTKRKVWFVK